MHACSVRACARMQSAPWESGTGAPAGSCGSWSEGPHGRRALGGVWLALKGPRCAWGALSGQLRPRRVGREPETAVAVRRQLRHHHAAIVRHLVAHAGVGVDHAWLVGHAWGARTVAKGAGLPRLRGGGGVGWGVPPPRHSRGGPPVTPWAPLWKTWTWAAGVDDTCTVPTVLRCCERLEQLTL